MKENNNLTKTLLELGLNERISHNLEKHGIVTLEDLTNIYVSDLRDILHRYVRDEIIIRDFMKSQGVTFKKATYLNQFEESKIGYFDIEKLSEEEREDFLFRPLSDIGISKKLVDRLASNGVITVGDLVEKNNGNLREVTGNNGELAYLLRERLAKFNIEVESRDADMYFTQPKIDVKDVKAMSATEKKEFYSRPLSDIGVSDRITRLLGESGIKTIKDIDALSVKQVKKLFVGFNYGTYKKFVETLAVFGVDKHDEIYDRKFKESTKEKVDLDKLPEQERQKYLESSIEGMGFSDDVVQKFKAIGVKTVGDLTKISLKDVRESVNKNPYAIRKINAIMDAYGLDFVKLHTYIDEPTIQRVNVLALKSEDAEKILNMPIEALGINGKFVDVVKREKGVKTIGQLTSLKMSELKALKVSSSNNEIYSIRDRLSEFGLSFAPEVVESKYYNDDFIDNINVEDLKDEQKEALLKLKLDNFKFRKSIVDRLKHVNIHTLGDLIEVQKPELRKITNLGSIAIQEIETTLAGLGIAMKGSSCYVVNGKVVSKVEDIKDIKTERKVELVDINTLKTEEKEKMLDTKLSDLGLHVRAIDLIEKKSDIRTIRDLSGLYLSDIENLLANNDEYIEHTLEVLSACGITFERKPRPTSYTYESLEEKALKRIKECKSKEEILSLSLTEAGISRKSASTLESLGITTIEDLTKKSKNQLINLTQGNYALVKNLSNALDRCGLSFSEKGTLQSQDRKVEKLPKMNANMDEETKKYFRKTSFGSVGIGKKVSRVLTENGQLTSLGDLLEKTPTELYIILGNNDAWYYKIRELLKEEGVKLPNLMYVKREIVESGAGASSSLDHENKYFTRQMEHYGKYLEYVKARNKKQYTEDFKE